MPLILLVDDSSEFRATVRVALEAEGWEVLEAVDGREAIRLFRRTRPDLVLLDMIMPEKDGIETLRELLAMDRTAVVFTFSGRLGGADYGAAASILGARRGFSKPFRVAELVEAIRQELSSVVA